MPNNQTPFGKEAKEDSSPFSRKVKSRSKQNSTAGRMKLSIIIGVVVLLLLVAGVITYMQIGHRLGREPLPAEITQIEGAVLIQEEDEAVTTSADPGMTVETGDTILTEEDSQAELKFADDSVARVAPDSRLVLEDLYQGGDGSNITILNIEMGRVWNFVEEFTERNCRFDVETPTSVAGVRGTGFSVEVEDEDVASHRVYAGEIGVVEAQTDREAIVGAYEQSIVEAEVEPVAEPLDVIEVDDWERDNLVEDLPREYVEVETETKDIELAQVDEEIAENQELQDELAQREQELEELLEEVTDPDEIAELEAMLESIRQQQEHVDELLDILEEEKDYLLERRDELEELRELIEEQEDILEPEELEETIREEARESRRREGEVAEERQRRRESIDNIQRDLERIQQQEEEEVDAPPVDDVDPEPEDPEDPIEDPTPVEPEPEDPEEPEPEDPEPEDPEEDPEPEDPEEPDPEDPEEDPEPEDPEDDPEETPSPPSPTPTPEHNVSTSATTGGAVTGEGTYEEGEAAEVVAIPDPGYRFLNWTKDGEEVSAEQTYTFEVEEDKELIAHFEEKPYLEEVEVINAKFVPLDDNLKVAYIELELEPETAGQVEVAVDEAPPFAGEEIKENRYRFEGVITDEPNRVVVYINGDGYNLDVDWVES